MMMRRPFIIGGVWFFLGLIYSGQSFFYSLSVGRDYLWQRSIFHSFVFCLEWALLTPIVLSLTERFRLDAGTFRRNILIHFFAGILIAFTQQTVYVYVTQYVDNGYVLSKTFSEIFPSIIGFFEYGVLVYWAVVFIFHSTEYYRRYRAEQKNSSELRSRLVEAQLHSLKMQLQPHFLFNTLNAISVLVKKEPSLAQKMIVRLSDLLRLSLERGDKNTLILLEELEMLDAYLEIEKVRFGERMTVKRVIDPASLYCHVPAFILQPLVENAVRHGISQRSGNGWITIVTSVKNGTLTLEISDGGERARKKKEGPGGTGIGLENTQLRLKQLYGDQSGVTLNENNENGHRCTVVIPAETK